MYELARNPSIQARLYAEVAEVIGQYSDDTDTLEHHLHEQMPYLQAVIKETLRLHAVVAHGIFKAGTDNVIPLSEPIITPRGESLTAVPVQAGQRVVSDLFRFYSEPEQCRELSSFQVPPCFST